MKKIVYAVLATVTGLVLLFSYRTSLDAAAPVASAPKSPSTTGATSTGSPSASGSASSDGTTGSSASGSADSSSSASTGSSSSGSGTTGGSSAQGGSGSSSSTSSSSGLKDGSFTGQAVDTRYGPVQVRITVSGGRITDVSVPEYPTSERRDQEINSQAIPQLVSETEDAQSAQIDMVSGATFTSDGYTQSLQSAIDQATA